MGKFGSDKHHQSEIVNKMFATYVVFPADFKYPWIRFDVALKVYVDPFFDCTTI